MVHLESMLYKWQYLVKKLMMPMNGNICFPFFHADNVGKRRLQLPVCTLCTFLINSSGSSAEEVQNRSGDLISIYSIVLRLKTIETGQNK